MGELHDRSDFGFWNRRDRTVANFPPGSAQNKKGANSKSDRCDSERGAHSNQIGQSRNTETGNRHQPKKTHAEHGGDATAQRVRRPFLYNRVSQTKIIERATERRPIQIAVSIKLLDRDMHANPAATATALPVINLNRFSGAIESKPRAPAKAPLAAMAINAPS